MFYSIAEYPFSTQRLKYVLINIIFALKFLMRFLYIIKRKNIQVFTMYHYKCKL